MPIYEYQCQACGHQLEALQKIADKPLVDCPACGKASLSKMISAAAFKLKGTGWYETDFKTGGKSSKQAESASNGAKKSTASQAGGQ